MRLQDRKIEDAFGLNLPKIENQFNPQPSEAPRANHTTHMFQGYTMYVKPKVL